MKITFTLADESIRQSVIARVRAAPRGWRITIDENKRGLDANARFHAALAHFAKHAEHFGRRLSVATWKAIFLAELAKEHGADVEVVPSLDGSELITVGRSTSDLSARDFSDLTELVYSEGTKRGIEFYEPRLDPEWTPRRARKAKGVTPAQITANANKAA